ncbi:MAG TPA: hypothetical protein VFO01_15835 [Trebonia sp.]|nr:hypothetical protein [Trebonia sp.]
MSEHVATEYEGTRPVPGEPGHAGGGPAKAAAQDVGQPLQQSPAYERKR